MSDTDCGRNFYYSGKFDGESDMDVLDRLSLVHQRDALETEVKIIRKQLRLVASQLEAYKELFRYKLEEEVGTK
jgi:hypothetical protein